MRRLKELDPSVPVVMLTAHGSIDLAVQAIKDGAESFLTKPVELPALLRDGRAPGRAPPAPAAATRPTARRDAQRAPAPFLGDSPAVQRLAEQAARVAAAPTAVLIQGETGSGKGVLARWLHDNGPRAPQPFVDLNCAGLSRELLESELFGYQKGAFTGAVTAKQGLWNGPPRHAFPRRDRRRGPAGPGQAAEGAGGDALPPAGRRPGPARRRAADRGHAPRPRRALVQEGKFREDLYYRIRGVELRVPPLRERDRDVIQLARSFLQRIAADLARPGLRLTPSAEQALLAHGWPGNVRELRNVLEHAALLSPRDALLPEDFADLLRPPRSAPGSAPARMTLDEAERQHVESVLRQEGWAVERAAGVLGISRTSLYERMRKYGISRKPPAPEDSAV